jgi:hypothetical protein
MINILLGAFRENIKIPTKTNIMIIKQYRVAIYGNTVCGTNRYFLLSSG